MATLEDAAEALLIKLRGLDSHIEETEAELKERREEIDEIRHSVEPEWLTLSEAVTSFLDKVHEVDQHLEQQAQQTLQALGGAHDAVTGDGEQALAALTEGHAQLDALGQHASRLEPAADTLAAEAGEAPAHALAQRAHELEQQLTAAMDDAHHLIHDEVMPALAEVEQDVRERCQQLHRALAEELTAALHKAYGEWESRVGRMEDYVATHGFEAAQQHAHEVVDYAMGECQTSSEQLLADFGQVVQLVVGGLRQLAGDVAQAGGALWDAGLDLVGHLSESSAAAADALRALDAMKDLLAGHSFISM